ncbi:MAG: hypothetical protein EA360_08600 [Balneolaceae bacterium]|nr:MAG: hypothetical protein EA360_08600 [Balneolaceae bacterium]
MKQLRKNHSNQEHDQSKNGQNPETPDSALCRHGSLIPSDPMLKQTVSLRDLPLVKTGPGFDSRMAALFALELEREILCRNKSVLQRKRGIRLPDLITNLREEFQ